MQHAAVYRRTHAQLAQEVGRASPVAEPMRRERLRPRTVARKGYVTPEDLRADLQRRVAPPAEGSPAPFWVER